MAMHSSILAWKIAWTEEPGGLHFMAKELGMTEPVCMHTHTHTHTHTHKQTHTHTHTHVLYEET